MLLRLVRKPEGFYLLRLGRLKDIRRPMVDGKQLDALITWRSAFWTTSTIPKLLSNVKLTHGVDPQPRYDGALWQRGWKEEHKRRPLGFVFYTGTCTQRKQPEPQLVWGFANTSMNALESQDRKLQNISAAKSTCRRSVFHRRPGEDATHLSLGNWPWSLHDIFFFWIAEPVLVFAVQ
ncbi:hypothetical protein BDZ88DRAFT_408378 [Geranomyces variabilis]|nr:hypothetical protein BDZ88DRAFT_408378 [Geranomyces variabilis]